MYDVPTQFVRLFEQTDRLDVTSELLEDHAPAENMQWILNRLLRNRNKLYSGQHLIVYCYHSQFQL